MVKNKLIDFIPFFIWVIIIYVLLTMPAKDFREVDIEIPYADKIVHAGIFAVMVLLFAWPYRFEPFKKNAQKILLIAIVATLYGIAMEFVQKNLTNPRGYEEWDMVADAAGALIGFFMARILVNYFNDRQKRNSIKNA